MQAEIERFSDLRTVLFPHPVEAAQAPKIEGTTKNTNIHKRGEEVSTTDYADGHRCGAGLGLAIQAGAGVSDPSTGELARDSENKSLTRSASIPAVALPSEGGSAGGNQIADSGNFLDCQSQAGLQMVSQKLPTLCEAMDSDASGNNASSVPIRVIGGSHSEALDAGRSALDSPSKPVVVLAPGLARYEKGSDIFQEAIKLILSNEVASGERRVTSAQNQSAAGLSEPVTNYSLPVTAPVVPLLDPRRSTLDSSQTAPAVARSVKFVMQWPEDFDLPDGRRCAPDPDLLKDERVKFSKDSLAGEAYWDFLQQADVIVLPYRSGSYRARVSRVAIEAAMLGKPMVYTKGTWISEVVAMGGAGVAIAEETPQSLAEAIQMAIGDLDMLQSEAERGVARVREFYSVSSFHRLLDEVGGNKKSNIAE
jgi:hypothetical protein